MRSRIRSRICAWMVTSSAVVGSSAISSFGLQASAMAIITRWRMPPESWCGYSRTRRSGSGMPTSAASRPPAPRASRADSPWCSRSVSPICRPTVSTGLSEVIGSWKIIEMSLPRMLAHLRARAAPADRGPRSGSRPAIRAGRRLDQPQDRQRGDGLAAAGLADDRQRLARVDANDTPSTARTTPSRRAEMGLQVLDFERAAAARAIGPSTSLQPSRGAGRARRAGRRPAG